MKKLEIFYDYACPYCLRAHDYLLELMPLKDIEIAWVPCEAHPRPEQWKRYSDLCVQSMYYAVEKGVDLWKFHEKMYNIALKQNVNIENVEELANAFRGFFDAEDYIKSMKSGKYKDAPTTNNDYAYEECNVWALPSYVMGDKRLDSAEGVGVTKEQLASLIK